MSADTADVVVVGAGWAGLAAAVGLSQRGLRPLVLEAAPRPGGRARAVELTVGEAAVQVDNGQHLLVGAYVETLRLAALVAPDGAPPLRRSPLRLDSVSGLSLAPAHLPAPWHLAIALLRARGLSWSERLAMIRLIGRLRLNRWRVRDGETVAGLLGRAGQPDSLVRALWEPLCVATLNTPLTLACARTFASVLRDTLGAEPAASDFLLPQATLSDVFPDPAVTWLAAHGTTFRFRCTARALAREAGDWRIETSAGAVRARSVILALPPTNVARLLPDADAGPARPILEAFDYEPIATAYLFWPADAAPALPPWVMLEEDPSRGWHGQWLFDRGEPAAASSADPRAATCMRWRCAAVVVSARGRAWIADAEDGAERLARQVASQLRVPTPAQWRLLVDKRATFRCTPQRPLWRTDALAGSAPGLWLAGDWLWPDYPATLESAVRSGLAAARAASVDR